MSCQGSGNCYSLTGQYLGPCSSQPSFGTCAQCAGSNCYWVEDGGDDGGGGNNEQCCHIPGMSGNEQCYHIDGTYAGTCMDLHSFGQCASVVCENGGNCQWQDWECPDISVDPPYDGSTVHCDCGDGMPYPGHNTGVSCPYNGNMEALCHDQCAPNQPLGGGCHTPSNDGGGTDDGGGGNTGQCLGGGTCYNMIGQSLGPCSAQDYWSCGACLGGNCYWSPGDGGGTDDGGGGNPEMCCHNWLGQTIPCGNGCLGACFECPGGGGGADCTMSQCLNQYNWNCSIPCGDGCCTFNGQYCGSCNPNDGGGTGGGGGTSGPKRQDIHWSGKSGANMSRPIRGQRTYRRGGNVAGRGSRNFNQGGGSNRRRNNTYKQGGRVSSGGSQNFNQGRGKRRK